MSKRATRRVVSLCLLAALVVGATACEQRETGQGVGAKATGSATQPKPGAGTAVPGVTPTEIKLGSWAPLSGPAAAWGIVLHGMNAYFAHINEQGGIHGRKITFIYRDDQYNPSKTPAIVRELVEKEKVFATIGGIGTANGRAVVDYLEKNGVPLFTPSTGDKFWSEGGKTNVYTVFPKYETEGELLGNYVGREMGAKKVAVLYQDDDFGKQGLEGIKKGLSKHEGAEVVAEVSCQPTDTDLAGQASQIAEKAPDVLAIFAGPKQAITAVKTLDAQKKKPQIVTSFVLSDPLMFKLAGESWEGTVTSAVMKTIDEDDESVKLYLEVVKKYGGGKLPPGTFSMAGFAFAMPFTEALQRAGKDLTREKVYTALNGLNNYTGAGPHWKGESLGPPVTFRKDKRLGSDQIYIAKAKAGKWEKVTGWLSLEGGADNLQAVDKTGDAKKADDQGAKPPEQPKK